MDRLWQAQALYSKLWLIAVECCRGGWGRSGGRSGGLARRAAAPARAGTGGLRQRAHPLQHAHRSARARRS